MNRGEKRRSVVIYRVQDLLFRSRIEEICKQVGSSFSMVDSAEELKASFGKDNSLIVCDLASAKSDLKTIREICSVSGSLILGYYSHVDAETRKRAEAHGVDFIVPRSAFQQKLIQLLSKR